MANTNTNPNRQPAGTPRGGQFAPGSHPESEVTLDGDDWPRPSGGASCAESGNVRVRLSTGLPSFAMPGATAGAERGLRDRVRAAFVNSDIAWPLRACDDAEMIGRLGLDGSVHPVNAEVAQRIADGTSARSVFVAPGQELSVPPGVETVEVANPRNLADRLAR